MNPDIKVRVGFILPEFGDGWLGGLNYYSGLISAIRGLENRAIEPLVFVNSGASAAYQQLFAGAKIVRSSLFQARTLANAVWKVSGKAPGGWHPALELLLRAHNVQVLSHFRPVRLLSAGSISWIPDLQELHFPEYFSRRELALRRQYFLNAEAWSDIVLVSSNDAVRDLQKVFPHISKERVLPFVPRVQIEDATRDTHPSRTEIRRPYFFFPAQFWVHKNHSVVLNALEILRDKGVPALVVATGKEYDHRHPQHARVLLQSIVDRNLTGNFVSLGAISYDEVQSLMRGAMAVINPSRFEGWSTTVEEAALLGKPVLLSNIAVHREQAPPKAMYFSPDSASDLATLMETCVNQPDESSNTDTLARRYRAKRLKFARKFQSIVLDLLRSRMKSERHPRAS